MAHSLRAHTVDTVRKPWTWSGNMSVFFHLWTRTVNTDHVKKVLLCNSFYQHGPQTRVAYTADPFVQPVFMTDEHGQCVSSLSVIFMAFYFPSGCLSGCSLTLFVTHYLCSVKLTTSVHHVNVNVSFSALILRFSHLACKIIPKMTYYVLSEVLSLYTRHVNGKSGKGFQVQRSRSLGLKFMVSLWMWYLFSFSG